jgi:periplasmic divalent cation tolerance protein
MADAVVGRRLAACANVAPVHSRYWWEGQIVRAREVRVTFTTARGRLRALVAAVEALHPYKVPYIAWGDDLAVPAAYAAWVTREAGGPRSRSRPSRRPPVRRTR